jgi:Fe-Mn family superoxide dismutase
MYQAKDFSHIQNVGNITNKSFSLHLKLYEGYVQNVNTLIKKLQEIKDQKTVLENREEFSELHRRFAWEFNGMRLHEIFFGQLSEEKVFDIQKIKSLEIYKQIEKDFSSFKNWQEDFINIAKTRGFGWTVLIYDPIAKKLFNSWINEHDTGIFANCKIVFAIDMLEHAYIIDFGTDRATYLQNIFEHTDFQKVEENFLTTF